MDSTNLPFYPNVVKVELAQGCNRSCYFCGINGIEDHKYFMTVDTAKHIRDILKTANKNFRIVFSLHGEPLLNPNAVEIVKMFKEVTKHPIQLFSNGDIFKEKPELFPEVLSVVDDLVLDVYDTPLPDDMKKIRSDLKAKYPEALVVIMDKGVPFYKPKEEKRKRILLCPSIALQDNLDVPSRKLNTHCGAGGDPSKVLIKTNKRCEIPFRQLAFRWNGKVAVCCNDYRGDLPIVNAMECSDFKEVWWCDAFKSIRRILYASDRTLFPCNKCNNKGNRLGLLPDPMGRMTLKKPTEEDYAKWREQVAKGPLATPRKRSWENE